MIVKGLQKFSLIDYPPYTCCVIFTAGCNFRCSFCHNKELVLHPETLPTIGEDELYNFLHERKPWLDGICICGGEPTIHRDLPEHIARFKEMGYKVKLDTNGTNPTMVRDLIDRQLIDYIAMDIKAPLDKYETVVNVPINKSQLQEMVTLLMHNHVPYEFRMTVVPTLVEENDFHLIGQWLRGAEQFYVQQFSNKKCLQKALEKVGPFPLEKLEEFKNILARYITHVAVRGGAPLAPQQPEAATTHAP